VTSIVRNHWHLAAYGRELGRELDEIDETEDRFR